MIEAGFGRRLSGGLYQVATVDLQVVAMNHAMIALFLLLGLLSIVAALLGWFSQSANQDVNEFN